jgi:hypothetical protein
LALEIAAIEADSKSMTLSVDIEEIRKLLIHLGRRMPDLFLYTVPTAAARSLNIPSLNIKVKYSP